VFANSAPVICVTHSLGHFDFNAQRPLASVRHTCQSSFAFISDGLFLNLISVVDLFDSKRTLRTIMEILSFVARPNPGRQACRSSAVCVECILHQVLWYSWCRQDLLDEGAGSRTERPAGNLLFVPGHPWRILVKPIYLHGLLIYYLVVDAESQLAPADQCTCIQAFRTLFKFEFKTWGLLRSKGSGPRILIIIYVWFKLSGRGQLGINTCDQFLHSCCPNVLLVIQDQCTRYIICHPRQSPPSVQYLQADVKSTANQPRNQGHVGETRLLITTQRTCELHRSLFI